MALIVGAVLAVFSVAIVVYPFLKHRVRLTRSRLSRTGGQPAVADPAPPELESLYDAIRTLQLEYQLGKVPEYLYREQLRGYRVQSAAALRQRAEDRSGAPDWLLEQEVLLARAALQGTDSGPRPCPNCRSLAVPGMVVCPECGTSLGRQPQGRG